MCFNLYVLMNRPPSHCPGGIGDYYIQSDITLKLYYDYNNNNNNFNPTMQFMEVYSIRMNMLGIRASKSQYV